MRILILLVLSVLPLSTLASEIDEAVCSADMYDPSVSGLFKVTDVPFRERSDGKPLKAAAMSVTNNYDVPLQIRMIVFGVAHEGSYELGQDDWSLHVADTYATIYDKTDGKYGVLATLHHDVDARNRTFPNAVTSLPFTLYGDTMTMPPKTSRHFGLNVEIPQHVLSTKIRVRLSHMVIRPLWPEVCQTKREEWGDNWMLFTPPGVPTYAQLRELVDQ